LVNPKRKATNVGYDINGNDDARGKIIYILHLFTVVTCDSDFFFLFFWSSGGITSTTKNVNITRVGLD
jgi:hypothetical protein